MPKILKISGQEIDQALQDATRQYLVQRYIDFLVVRMRLSVSA
jgi:hypothetical protein